MNVIITFTFLLLHAYCSITGFVNGQTCEKLTQLSGEIYDSHASGFFYSTHSKCWSIKVPENSYVRLNFTELNLDVGLWYKEPSCSSVYVKVVVNGGHENYTFCYKDTKKTVTASYDVNISYYHHANGHRRSSFRMKFNTENSICAQKNHFRCSPNFCIHEHQVCNGVKDCENGADEVGCETGIMAAKGMNESRINAINWLKKQRTDSYGWGKNTHRAITALYLSKAMTFQGNNLEEELIAKQLELQTSIALLKNESDPLSISELSMFVNALTVTCYNPRHFYGYDLVQILGDRVASAKSPVPSAYLALCNLNWTISNSEVKNLMTLLNKDSNYPFYLDVKALTIMALTCIMNKTEHFRTMSYAKSTYKSAVQNFVSQNPDGSFGNVHTTALVTQALIASGQEEETYWNATAAARYLMKQLNSSSVDFLSVYLTLPIFSGKSLVDIKVTDCSNKTRKEEKHKEISEVTDKLGRKTQIQYSLYIGDQKDVVHTMYLRMPENSSAFDVMKVAQVADPKYKFLESDVSGQKYIYGIAGITNDPEALKFWLLYTGDHFVNGTAEHHTESPDKLILGDNDHLIMWYRTAHI